MRSRQSAHGLLPRMDARRWSNGKTITYRWSPSVGAAWINLGQDRLAAIAYVAKQMHLSSTEGTLSTLWQRYTESLEYGYLAPTTKLDYQKAAKQFLKPFGDMLARDLSAPDLYKYMTIYRQGKSRANNELAVLVQVLQCGVHRGELTSNVAKLVSRVRVNADRYMPEIEDVSAFATWLIAKGGTRAKLAVMAQLAAYAGNRRAEFIGLTLLQIGQSEIRLSRAKQRGNEQLERVTIEGELVGVVAAMRALERPDGCLYVFTNQRGGCMTEGGFNSLWHRSMTEAVGLGVVSRRFKFHALRKWYVTEHKRQTGELPDLHKNKATTARIYDRTKVIKRAGL